jgi:hypothetical protein
MANTKTQNAADGAISAALGPSPVTNCNWSNNNAACTNTWFCLSKDIMGQLTVAFDAAQTIKMSELTFWNEVASGDSREAEAEEIASMLTKLFTGMLGATYEAGQNMASAVIAMTQILTDSGKTVCELAAVVDEQHHFLGEQN